MNINVGGGAIVDFNTAGSFNPADATTYYFGGFPGLAPSTSATSRKLWMPRAGVIRAVYGNIVYLGAGSNEASTLSLRLNDTRFAGAKAAQLGEVARLKNIRTPGGFVIPVSHYLHHLSRTGAAADLPAQLADATFARDAAGRTRWLANVRATIERTAIDAQLVRDVH